jgi:phosphoribosylglycinamide formyltransferase-1
MLKNARPLRVALLSSRRCPGVSAVLRAHRRGELEVVCCVTSDEAFADRSLLQSAEVPVIPHPIRPFYAERGAPIANLALRRDYDRVTARLLSRRGPDLILLSSYLFLLTDPLLDAYPGRIVNVHGSDLARVGSDGRPLYRGLRAVRDALRAGERETRATAHIVTPRLDEGLILLRSHPYPVPDFVEELRRIGNVRAVDAYAYAHQEWMLATAWGPLLTGAAGLAASWRTRSAAALVGLSASGGRA